MITSYVTEHLIIFAITVATRSHLGKYFLSVAYVQIFVLVFALKTSLFSVTSLLVSNNLSVHSILNFPPVCFDKVLFRISADIKASVFQI